MFHNKFNYEKLSDNLYTAGMPDKDQLEDVIKQSVQVVINLAPHTVEGALTNEETIVKSLQATYINIPVDWNTPTYENLVKFMDLMDTLSDKVVLVHCQANFRASSFVAIYRILRKGWNPEKAMQIMHEIWDEEVYPVWKEFIEETIFEGNLKKGK